MRTPPDAVITTTTTAPTHVRWRIFAVIFILVVINLIDRTALSIAMPTIAQELALSPFMQGLILSSFFWSYALLQIPAGWLIDRFGPRYLVTGATVAWGMFQTLAALASSGLTLLAMRIGLGAAEAPLFPAGAKLNANWLSPQERGRGAVLMDCGGPLGAALGGIVIAWLILTLNSWRAAFIVTGLITMGLGVLAWWYLRDLPQQHPKVNHAELARIAPPDAAHAATAAALPQAASARPISSRSLVALLLGRMSWAMINFGLLTWGPSYLAQARGMNLQQMGGAIFVIFLAGMFGSLSSGFLVDRLQQRGMRRGLSYKLAIGISGTGVMLAFLVLPHVASASLAVAVLAATLFLLYFGSLYWSFPAILAPREKVGLLGGVMNFAGSASGIAIPIITGLVLQLTGSYGAVLAYFVGCAALYVIGTLAIDFKDGRDV